MFTLGTFYKSKEWERFREQIILERTQRDGELICEKCGQPILRRYDCIVHHKQELTEENVNDFLVSLNPENVEILHHRCHNIEHERFEGFRQKVFIVYGPPCAGKTTWVKQNAREDDLILDLDRIWEAICFSDREHKPDRLKPIVFGIRDTIIDQIRIRKGNWRRAYVIGTYPLRSDRERLSDLLRAEIIFIDTDKATCLKRAENATWRGFIEEWFDDFTE